jgi:DNA-binding response OmpR family regulator
VGNPRLLLVDDEPHLGLIVGRIARMAGIEFAGRGDVPSALAFLQQHAPDLTLLDVNLPGMSGLELLRRLRATPALASRKVALFCQSGLTGDVASGWAAGADYLVWKDLISQPEALRVRLLTILAHAHGQMPMRSLTCPPTDRGPTGQEWVAPFEHALTRTAARELGMEVLEQVLARALAQAAFRPTDRPAWVRPGSGCLDRRALPLTADRHSLWVCFASLVDQLWCLLGPDASAQVADALQAVLDRC